VFFKADQCRSSAAIVYVSLNHPAAFITADVIIIFIYRILAKGRLS